MDDTAPFPANLFWAAWRRLKDEKPEPGDLDYFLSCVHQLWQQTCNLSPKAAAYDLMERIYRETPGSTKQKQAAACRAGGFTMQRPGPKGHTRHEILERWYALRRNPSESVEDSIERLGKECGGLSPGDMARTLRRFRDEIEALIPTTSGWQAGALRFHLEALTTEPAAIPAAWGESRKTT